MNKLNCSSVSLDLRDTDPSGYWGKGVKTVIQVLPRFQTYIFHMTNQRCRRTLEVKTFQKSVESPQTFSYFEDNGTMQSLRNSPEEITMFLICCHIRLSVNNSRTCEFTTSLGKMHSPGCAARLDVQEISLCREEAKKQLQDKDGVFSLLAVSLFCLDMASAPCLYSLGWTSAHLLLVGNVEDRRPRGGYF